MIDSLHRALSAIGQRRDLVVVVLVVVAILMMILPLPTWLVDTLIGVNIASAVLLLMMALYLRDPLEFSTLPSIILITTIFRLALAITTTRLILLQADAGEIINTFGQFVIAGELIVGLVVFLIITIVQFVVITKGSERVAEVAARFQLDALPGKQMSIDGDLRTGDLTAAEARIARARLEEESRFFGAMDGAMKFVKGDAIAGLVIVAVNLIGGIAIGMTRRDMSAGEAVDVYSLLTVGDGLATQLPALFVSLAAGSVITRVSTRGAETLGADITRQMTSSSFALRVAGVIVLLMMFVPGFPWPVFLVLGMVLLTLGYAKPLRALLADRSGRKAQADRLSRAQAAEGSPLALHFDPVLLPEREILAVNAALDASARDLANHRGIATAPLRLVPNPNLRFFEARFVVDGAVTEALRLDPRRVTVAADTQTLTLDGFKAEPLMQQFHTIPRRDRDKLTAAGIAAVPVPDVLANLGAAFLRLHGAEGINAPAVRAYLTDAARTAPDIVAEVREAVPLPRITDVFRRLTAEAIPLRQKRKVLEALADWGQREKNAAVLTDYVRTALARQICTGLVGDDGLLPVYVLGADVEDALRAGIRQTSAGEYLSLDESAGPIAGALAQSIRKPEPGATQPVILTSLDIRRFVRSLLVRNGMGDVPVLSYQDLADDVTAVPLATILMPRAVNSG